MQNRRKIIENCKPSRSPPLALWNASARTLITIFFHFPGRHAIRPVLRSSASLGRFITAWSEGPCIHRKDEWAIWKYWTHNVGLLARREVGPSAFSTSKPQHSNSLSCYHRSSSQQPQGWCSPKCHKVSSFAYQSWWTIQNQWSSVTLQNR